MTFSAYYPLSLSFRSGGSHPPQGVFNPHSLLCHSLTLASPTKGKFDVQLLAFGTIPIRNLTVNVEPPPLVIPGGQAIGVLLSSHGVVIVGHLPVTGVDHKQYYPAKEAGLKIGDLLLKINDS
jgi:stage IV sporulation protein B